MSFIAYCGLICDECPVFIATQTDDFKAKELLAVEYSNEIYRFTAEDMNCEGCFCTKNDSSKMCGDCDIRNCAKDKALYSCGVCSSYPCGIIEKRLPSDAENRLRLDKISEKLHNR